MDSEQILLVQETWQKVLPIQPVAAQLFYDRLFTLDPSLRTLFSGDIQTQGQKLMSMINVAVNGLTRLDTIVTAVQQLGARHAGYGVRDEHYAVVGDALLWTLQQGLGDAFTPRSREAWSRAYGLLSGVMMQAAAAALPRA
jgi:hemoglobin-like flavoprotein